MISENAETIDDLIFFEKVKKFRLVFDEQANLAVYYAFLELKEQEIRNIHWYAQLIASGLEKNHPGWKKIVYLEEEI